MKVTGPHRFPIKAGAAVRRPIRRRLLESGLLFTEDRGFLDSLFLVEIPEGATVTIPDDWFDRR